MGEAWECYYCGFKNLCPWYKYVCEECGKPRFWGKLRWGGRVSEGRVEREAMNGKGDK